MFLAIETQILTIFSCVSMSDLLRIYGVKGANSVSYCFFLHIVFDRIA